MRFSDGRQASFDLTIRHCPFGPAQKSISKLGICAVAGAAAATSVRADAADKIRRFITYPFESEKVSGSAIGKKRPTPEDPGMRCKVDQIGGYERAHTVRRRFRVCATGAPRTSEMRVLKSVLR
jgi:hypothetical protein